jgi:glutathione S-transferase
MSITVYQFPHSPYCIPVTQALTALGVPFEVRNTPNGDRRELIELTGGGSYQVPVLKHGERVIFEPTPDAIRIPRYLDEEWGNGRLFPAELEGLQGILIPHIEDDVEGITFKLTDPHYLASLTDPVERVMVLRHKERKFGPGCEERWLADRESLTAQAAAILRPFDQILAHRPWLLADAPVYTDFLLFGILGNLTWEGHNALPAGQKHLADWVERLRAFRY